jgi:hypothetical protein
LDVKVAVKSSASLNEALEKLISVAQRYESKAYLVVVA